MLQLWGNIFYILQKNDILQSRYGWIGEVLNRLMQPDSVPKDYCYHMYRKNISEQFARVLKVAKIV